MLCLWCTASLTMFREQFLIWCLWLMFVSLSSILLSAGENSNSKQHFWGNGVFPHQLWLKPDYSTVIRTKAIKCASSDIIAHLFVISLPFFVRRSNWSYTWWYRLQNHSKGVLHKVIAWPQWSVQILHSTWLYIYLPISRTTFNWCGFSSSKMATICSLRSLNRVCEVDYFIVLDITGQWTNLSGIMLCSHWDIGRKSSQTYRDQRKD